MKHGLTNLELKNVCPANDFLHIFNKNDSYQENSLSEGMVARGSQ